MKFNHSIQGSKNASVFTRAMQVTFSHIQDIVNFWVDDLIAHSKTVEEHLKHLDTIFARTLDSNLKMSPEKCKFLAGKIKYLGRIVKDDSFSIAEKKLQAIQELPIPKTYNNLRSQLLFSNITRNSFHSSMTLEHHGKTDEEKCSFPLNSGTHRCSQSAESSFSRKSFTQAPKPKLAVFNTH